LSRLARGGTPLLLGLLAGLGALLVPSVALADREELEQRLIRAGVDADLRWEIHRSIERGSARLRSLQGESGEWRFEGGEDQSLQCDLTALCALAVRHAGGEENVASARRALQHLDAESCRGRMTSHGLGLTAMLVMTDDERPALGRAVGTRLVEIQDPLSGWWSYTRGAPGPNLWTTHHAVLGLWAGGRKHHEAPRLTWVKHLHSLLDRQSRRGSWPLVPRDDARDYGTGTFMGHANLLLCQAALAGSTEAESDLWKRLLAARKRSTRVLEQDALRVLKDPAARTESEPLGEADHVWTPYDRLHALEKACSFSEVEELKGVRWYVVGAQFLLENQRTDGSWGLAAKRLGEHARGSPGDVRATALALLFLTRSSEAYRPTAPRPLDAPVPAAPAEGEAAPR
jgi:hypothetical protein